MSRTQAFNEGAGHNWHPNVHDYASDAPGGIGSVQGSVVGMVPTNVLAAYRHHEGDVNGPDSVAAITNLTRDLRSGHGIEEPLVLEYDPQTQWAYLGEGNHRLRAAEEAGVPEVPVRIERSRNATHVRDLEGRGAQAIHNTQAELGMGHVPASLHPSMLQLTGKRGEHEAQDTVSEIMNLLEPRRYQ